MAPFAKQRSTIIVAGGSGKRLGGPVPKQFQAMKGRPLLMWTIEAFHDFDTAMPIIVVLPGSAFRHLESAVHGGSFLHPPPSGRRWRTALPQCESGFGQGGRRWSGGRA
ncbi:MAG: 2-C-methyl-D-erythritol 4-phosphate cytidylyltransferase [Flavobacteriales bacterium]|nr:2-C-methyl-D-erythritol 4-phosphate cytidylyltransferase [Flavobacteriales bacterium]